MIRPLERQPAWLVWITGATLSTALTTVAYLWIVVPVHQQQTARASLLTSVREKQSQSAALEAELTEFSNRLFREQAALAHQPVELGDRRDLNRRIASLIESARRVELEVLQLQPAGVKAGEHFDLVELRFEVVGTFAQHLAMLDTLHRDYPDMSVTDLSLSGAVRSANPRPTLALGLAWFTRVDGPGRAPAADTAEASVDAR